MERAQRAPAPASGPPGERELLHLMDVLGAVTPVGRGEAGDLAPSAHATAQPRAPGLARLPHPRLTGSGEVAQRREGPRLFFLWVEEKRNMGSIVCFKSQTCCRATNLRGTPWGLHPAQDECSNTSSMTSAGETLSCGF